MLGSKIFIKSIIRSSFLMKRNPFPLLALSRILTYIPKESFSMFNSQSKQIKSTSLDKYRKSFETDSLETYINNFAKNILPASFDDSPDSILIFLAKQHESPTKDSSASIKVQRSIQAIARFLKENSRPKTGNTINLQQKEGLVALVTLLTHSTGGFHLSLSSEVILNGMAGLIKANSLTFPDFLSVLGSISSSEKRVFHTKVFPNESGAIITNFIKQNLEKLDQNVQNDVLSRLSIFIHSFADLVNFKEVFSAIRSQIFLSIKVKLENAIKSASMQLSTLDLYLSALNYVDIYEPQLIGLTGQLKVLIKTLNANEVVRLDYALKFYKKTKGTGKNVFLGNHLFPLLEELLITAKGALNISNLKFEDLQTMGDMIIENKLSIPLVFNLIKSLLAATEAQKESIKLSKKEFIFEISGDEQIISEYAGLLADNPINTNVMNLKELITSIFVKFCSFFELKGLLLILYLNLEKFISLGKYESFLYFRLKENVKKLKEPDLMNSLTFLKTITRNKRYLVWFTPFEDIIEKALLTFTDKKGNSMQQLIELLIRGRKDFVYHDHRSFDLKLDNSLLENFGYLSIREVEFIMTAIVSSRLQCQGFFNKAMSQFEANYESMQLGTSINLLLRFSFLGMKVNSKIVDHIAKTFIEAKKGKPQFMHVTTPFKLLASIVLLRRFSYYEYSLYDAIFEAMMKNWEENYNEIDKEEIFASNFANNNLLFVKYIELFHEDYFNGGFLKGKGGALLNHIKNKPKHTFGGVASKTESEIGSIIRKIFPGVKVLENSFVFDGLLECDIRIVPRNGKEIFLEFFGPAHFTTNASFTLLGTSQMILDLKGKLGNVLMIPYFEWSELKNEGKERYIKEKIENLLEID